MNAHPTSVTSLSPRIGALAVSFRQVGLADLGQLAAARTAVLDAAGALLGSELEELVVLCTCNRFELLYAARDLARARDALLLIVARVAPRAAAAAAELRGDAALWHVMRVAASLESMLLGEGQILGQVRAARDSARTRGTIGPCLELLIDHALAAAKAVRSQTSLGNGRLSVASLAARAIAAVSARVAAPRVAVIGAGEMARKASLYLKRQGLRSLLIVNRTLARAVELAHELGAAAAGLDQFLASPPGIDILVTAASCPRALFGAPELRALRTRRELLVVDLAVPGNVADPVDLPGVQIRRLQDLQAEAEQNLARRTHEIAAAEAILAQKLEVVKRRLAERSAVPWLQQVEREAACLQAGHVEQLLKRELGHLSEPDKDLIRSFAEDLARRCAQSSMPLLRELCARMKEPA
ncbi:MAG: glutamyl-tRNA reductase [Planctomycetota bacterium]